MSSIHSARISSSVNILAFFGGFKSMQYYTILHIGIVTDKDRNPFIFSTYSGRSNHYKFTNVPVENALNTWNIILSLEKQGGRLYKLGLRDHLVRSSSPITYAIETSFNTIKTLLNSKNQSNISTRSQLYTLHLPVVYHWLYRKL